MQFRHGCRSCIAAGSARTPVIMIFSGATAIIAVAIVCYLAVIIPADIADNGVADRYIGTIIFLYIHIDRLLGIYRKPRLAGIGLQIVLKCRRSGKSHHTQCGGTKHRKLFHFAILFFLLRYNLLAPKAMPPAAKTAIIPGKG